MAKKVVIAGSASLLERVVYWKNFWEDQGCCVTDYPAPINKENFLEEYPKVHKDFFQNITEADIVFVMNEDKNGITGYLGAESFAEMALSPKATENFFDKNLTTNNHKSSISVNCC